MEVNAETTGSKMLHVRYAPQAINYNIWHINQSYIGSKSR